MELPLETAVVSQYEKIWDDAGTNAEPWSLSLYQPIPPEGWKPLVRFPNL
jgi:hypothetical protein